MSEEPIGKCFMCDAPVYAGKPRKILRWLPRVRRTCSCFDSVLYSLQQALELHVSPMPPLMTGMMLRERTKRE